MKECVKTCTIFYIFFLTYLFVYGITLIYSKDLQKLNSMLDDKQKAIYEKIKKERLHHFLMGLGIGGLLGFTVILSNIKITSKFCMAGLIVLFVMTAVYYILPKSDFMIKHLETEEKRLAWLNVSRNFMKKKMAGFVLAIIVYFCIPFVM